MMSCLFLYLLTTTLLTCGAQEYYVTPTSPPNPNCPSDKLCQTLDYYANNASGLINGRENVSLLFMSGYHYSETIFEIANVDNFTIAGLDYQEIASTTISLTQILISNGTMFTLKNIAISDTLLNVSDFQSMKNSKILCENSILSLRALQVDSILLTNSRLNRCRWLMYWGYSDEIGYYDPIDTAVVGIAVERDIVPTIEISETEFTSKSVTYVRLARSGAVSVNLNITFCSFTKTLGLIVTAYTVGLQFPESNLIITMDHCSMTDDMYGTIIYANKAHNVYVDISDFHLTAFASSSKAIELIAIESTINATVEGSNFLGGLGIAVDVEGPSTLELTVRGCNFLNSSLNSIYIFTNGGLTNALIEDCRFVGGFNSDRGLPKQDYVILVESLGNEYRSNIVLRNSLIMNNHFISGILVTAGLTYITIDNCTIKDNSAIVSGGLLAINSIINIMGNTIFENNTGSTGGAIYLFESSLTFTENLNLLFLNNKAESTGGAIFVTEIGSPTLGDEIVRITTDPNPKCFYQLATNINNNSSTPSSITFINNTAMVGGNNIYGAALKDNCTVTPNRLTKNHEIQNTLFNFQPISQSSVSSFPRRLCVCENGDPKCTDIDYIFINKSVTPGEKIPIEVMLVGYDFGGTTGGIFAKVLQTAIENNATKNEARVSIISKGEETQIDKIKFCTTVNYSVRGKSNTTTTFILTSSSLNAEAIERYLDILFTRPRISTDIQNFNDIGVIGTVLLFTPIFITAHLLPCPMGLEIDNKTGTCGCSRELLNTNLVTNCTVENGRTLITRNMNERAWFRIHNDSRHGLLFEYTLRCLNGHCNSAVLTIDPSNPDSQCALNQTGVLCGGCAEGLSLAIGSSRCLECSENLHLSLILVFLLLGIVLVMFIWILDLTISRGTINGLLFYVNMVSINREIFFVENTGLDDTLNNCLKAAQLFVDWCNLDFGIESCFIYQLNATGKIWLQFVFPLYVWSLAGLIIVACKYSTRLTKLFGNNSVSVLITLFLIAYLKLVQTILASFTFANILNLNNELVHKVWLVDGNVNYDDIHHIILCIVSGISAVFLSTVTVWLLLIKFTWKVPKHYKIEPILHSFTGRLKRNREYWIGLSLITRLGFAIGTILLPQVTILRILIVVLFILGLIVSQVYKRIYLSLLEIVFMLNLLTVSAIFIEQTNIELLAVSISVSVLISALMFMGICIYHGIKCVQRVRPKVASYLRTRRETKRKIKEAENEQQIIKIKSPTLTLVDLDSDITQVSNSQNQIVRKAIDFSKYREELLDSTEF